MHIDLDVNAVINTWVHRLHYLGGTLGVSLQIRSAALVLFFVCFEFILFSLPDQDSSRVWRRNVQDCDSAVVEICHKSLLNSFFHHTSYSPLLILELLLGSALYCGCDEHMMFVVIFPATSGRRSVVLLDASLV